MGNANMCKRSSIKILCLGIGPAGTGKTYLAVVMAVAALKRHEVERLILTRPAVEAGESLGFLPGDLKEKVDPYLRPIYDALKFDLRGRTHGTFDRTRCDRDRTFSLYARSHIR